MSRALALVLSIALAAPAFAQDEAIKSIAYARWIDIGPGRGIAQMKPMEIAALRRCKDWTMYFQPSGEGLTQTFVAGMTMSNTYSRVQISRLAGETIFILSQKGSSKTHDTLHLSKDGVVLTQISAPFRPHTFLRCFPAEKAQ